MSKDVADYFSPNRVFNEGIAQKIIKALGNSQHEILNLSYSFTNAAIASAIQAAIARGVNYQGAWDKGSTHSAQATLHDLIVKTGGTIRLVSGFGKIGIMHAKVFIIDRQLLIAGSYNFTNNAELNNYEISIMVTETAAITKAFAAFQTIFGKGIGEARGLKTSIRRVLRHARSIVRKPPE